MKKPKGCCTIGKLFIFIIFEIIVILVTAAVVFLFLNYEERKIEREPSRKVNSSLTLDKLLSSDLFAARFNGSWISDDEFFMLNSDFHYVIYNVSSGTEQKILTNETLIKKSASVLLSPDREYLLITYDHKREFRWSSNFSALIYSTKSQTQSVLRKPSEDPLILQLFKWAPVGNGFVYIHSNDIYYRPNASSSKELRISTNGSPVIFNGICDWVYEEEVFGSSSAVWFSPDGLKLIYASFNDTLTDEMSITYYGRANDFKYQYPTQHFIQYPKAGRNNPSVKLRVVDLNEDKQMLQQAIQFHNRYSQQILVSVSWINSNDASVVVMNRVQNKAAVLTCSSTTGECKQIFNLENDKGWVEFFSPPLYSKDGQDMIYIYSWDQGHDFGGYRHLTMYNIAKKRPIALTNGRYTVTKILGWDQIARVIYFRATEEHKSMNEQIYKISINESRAEKPTCLSCGPRYKPSCNFSLAEFSERFSYRVQTCFGYPVPLVTLYDKNNNVVFLLEENNRLKKNLENITLPQIKFLSFKIEDDVKANVKLIIPPNIDKSGQTKYPLLVHVYGGPDFNKVLNKFSINDWNTYYSLNYNIIIALIDGRGSGRNGDKILYSNYRKLGSTEIEDQINVTSQIQNKFSFIDETRTGIWGWSYGGYATGMVLAKDSKNIFKCGVSIAPVTDWIFYDSIYTERYMGLPTKDDNLNGYKNSSLLNLADGIRGKEFLLIHGSYDDNVHFQNSMMLARRLEKLNIIFRQLVYPDETHSLSGVNLHLFRSLESFLNECFA